MQYQQPFNDATNYYYYKKAFSDKEIEKIYQDLEKIEIEAGKTLGGDENNERRSSVKWIPKSEEWNWVYQRLMEIALEANKKLWHFDIFTCENIQYTEYYATNDGHYNWHQDLGPEFASHRKISISVQLSNPANYSGGDLQFWLGGEQNVISVSKALGEATIFPSYLMHRVTQVHTGVRKSLVLWIGGSHFR
jgi:PKHD-type hydroxylase